MKSEFWALENGMLSTNSNPGNSFHNHERGNDPRESQRMLTEAHEENSFNMNFSNQI
jgi:hypothetical protein